MKFDHETKTIWIRQSWLDTAHRCPERGRLAVTSPEWDRESDAAWCGTAVHYAIEQFLQGKITADMLGDTAETYAVTQMPDPLEWNKFESVRHLVATAREDVKAWYNHIFPHVTPYGKTEVNFHVDLGVRYADGWRLGLEGTVDYETADDLWDWKTSSSAYKPYEKQREAVQPTMYALAAVLGGLSFEHDWPITFNYGVMQHMARYSRPQIVTVTRTRNHADFMLRQIDAFVDVAFRMGLDRPWPMIEAGNYLCSEKWCPWWSICRGANLTEGDLRYPDQIELTIP